MTRGGRLAGAAWLGLLAGTAHAADFPVRTGTAAAKPRDWNGAYFGGHVAYLLGSTHGTLPEPPGFTARQHHNSLYAGVQVGINHALPSGLVLGAEADVTFPNYLDPNNKLWGPGGTRTSITERIDFAGGLRARLGYAQRNWLPYVTGGAAVARTRAFQSVLDPEAAEFRARTRFGWVVGAGVEAAIGSNWSVRAEYLYSRYGTASMALPDGSLYASAFDQHSLRLGANYLLGWPGRGPFKAKEAEGLTISETSAWELRAQTTLVWSAYPRFPALYSGGNSLSPGGQGRETTSMSAFVGLRLWEGGELYYNPELLQGLGFDDTTGAAGFPNGEAQKSGFLYPRYNTSRLFLRHTFGLGGEQEEVESAYGQMAGKRDVSRLTVQAGKFSVKDMFDNNSYASDPRLHFLNWSMWAAGAFDYPADRLGLTYGAVAEVNQKDWAFRTAYFMVGDQPNSNNFDRQIFKRGGYVAEVEGRYTLLSRPGRVRVGGWLTRTFSGSYREAVELSAVVPGLDPNDAMLATRRGRTKLGYYVNLEQSVTDEAGLFARWSWNDGRNEIGAFTDIDASLSAGAVVKGARWGRPDDVLGLGGAVNGLSRDHRDYTAAGGLGVLIGDGRLNYREEKILETYYGLALSKQSMLTLDYQFILNPGYNADRGPVHVFTARLHAEM